MTDIQIKELIEKQDPDSKHQFSDGAGKIGLKTNFVYGLMKLAYNQGWRDSKSHVEQELDVWKQRYLE